MSNDLRELLNSKLSKIDNDFKSKMKQLQKINNESYTKLLKYKILNDGDFSLEDMSASNMIEKLFVVTNDPREVWNAI